MVKHCAVMHGGQKGRELRAVFCLEQAMYAAVAEREEGLNVQTLAAKGLLAIVDGGRSVEQMLH